jgi:hypothetical protein
VQPCKTVSRFAALLLVAMVSSTSLASCETRHSAPSSSSTQHLDTHGWLAWLSHGGVSVRERNGEARELAAVPAGPLDMPYGLRWSADGQALGWLENSDKGTGVAVYSFAAGSVWRSVPTEFPVDQQPGRLLALGSGFAAVASDGTVHEYVPGPRTGEVHARTVATLLRPGTDGLDSPEGLVGVGDRMLVATPNGEESSYGGPEPLVSVDVHGTTVAAWHQDDTENLPVFQTTYDGRSRIAFATGTTAGRCDEAVQYVDIRDTATWHSISVPALPEGPAGYFRSVYSLDFGPSGELVGSFMLRAVPCTGQDQAPDAWALQGGRWHQLHQASQWAAYEGGGQLAVLRPPTAAAVRRNDTAGVLVLLDSHGVSMRLADAVLEAQWAPKA